jgi:hypothetical protein
MGRGFTLPSVGVQDTMGLLGSNYQCDFVFIFWQIIVVSFRHFFSFGHSIIYHSIYGPFDIFKLFLPVACCTIFV